MLLVRLEEGTERSRQKANFWDSAEFSSKFMQNSDRKIRRNGDRSSRQADYTIIYTTTPLPSLCSAFLAAKEGCTQADQLGEQYLGTEPGLKGCEQESVGRELH